MDDAHAALIHVMREIGAESGLSLIVDGIPDATTDGTALAISTSVTRHGMHETAYRIDLGALPGGCGHMAYAIVRSDGEGRPWTIETMQLRRMLGEHAMRMARIEALLASGYDPLRPPPWSIETYAPTIDVMRALGARVEGMVDFLQGAGGIEATIPGLHGDEATASMRDSVLEWSTSPGSERRWSYSHSSREIRILRTTLPETALHTIRSTTPRVCDVVDDEVLGRVRTRVEGIRSHAGCTVLKLTPEWTWIAEAPADVRHGWRTS